MPDMRRMLLRSLGGLGLAATLATPLRGQRANELRIAPALRSWAAGDTLPPARQELNVPLAVGGAIVGGGLGGLAGIGVGIFVAENKHCVSDEYCGLLEALLSVVIGESIGLAVGTHYGSRGRGSLTGEILASVGVGLAGTILGAYAGGWPILLVPVAQLATVLALEHP
jgi:hypothetical protein